MDESEIKKLADTVEAGLRDGRSLESLRRAMDESGYSEDEVRQVISGVDRKKTIRRPQRPKQRDYRWAMAAAGVILIVFASFMIVTPTPGGEISTVNPSDIGEPGENEIRTCYVINESIKETMIEAGAQCDKWFLIKEI